MTAARALLVTHSSSLVMPPGRAPRHRCRGSMFRFTKGMARTLEGKQTWLFVWWRLTARATEPRVLVPSKADPAPELWLSPGA